MAADRRTAALPLALATGLAAGGTLTAGLLVGRAIEQRPSGDLPYPGAGTEWGLPVARLLSDLTAVGTLGFLVLAVALLPDRRGLLSGTAGAALVQARILAALWLTALAVQSVLNLSLSAAQPVSQIFSFALIRQYLTSVLEGQVALAGMVAAVVVLAAPPVRKVNSAAVLLGVAGLGILLPPLLTGHSASASGHDLAMTSLTVHVGAAALWVGGLVAVGWLALARRDDLAVALPRFSSLALGCFVAVLISGAVNAAIRLGRVDALWQDRYGLLVLGKVTLLLVLGGFGYRHRRRTLVPAADGRPTAFLRLAAVELVLLAATVALAVALSRSPTPVARAVPDVSPAKAALGYAMPGPVSAGRLLVAVQPQLVFLLLGAVGVLLYARAVRRLRSGGAAWSRGRSAAWYGGLAVVALATQSGLSRYGGVLFSVHMAQHLLLTVVAPPLLALGAPATLALRVLPVTGAGYRSARGWLVAGIRSPLIRVLSAPAVALGLVVVGTFGVCFSGVFDTLMRQHAGHLLMELFFLAAGCLLFWPLLSPDPLPTRPGPRVRLLIVALTIPFQAAVGLAILASNRVLAADWFGGLGRPWGSSLAADQHTAGVVALVLGVAATVLVTGAVVFDEWRNRRAGSDPARRGRTDMTSQERSPNVPDRSAVPSRPGPP